MEIMWHVLVFKSDTEFSMILPDSAFIFTAEIWAMVKALEEIKNASASKLKINKIQTQFRDSKGCCICRWNIP